ncbi:penicillin-binding protein 2 [candidate division KSB1 bacterium]|nr:penicillin-binding protein 2 [candidate division KSB1 bacterium]
MNEETPDQLSQRSQSFTLATAFIFLVILSRFFYIQILGSEEHYLRSEANRTRPVEEIPTRGLIFDRNNVLLVDNVPAYSIYVFPYELKDIDYLYELIGQKFHEDLENVKEKIKNAKTRYQPVKILSGLSHSDIVFFVENKLNLPGVMTQVEPKRYYPSGIKAPHFLGYIKEIDEDEIERSVNNFYKSGDLVGKQGLEKYYEEYLRGEKGYKFLEVDAFGREVGEIITANTKQAQSGKNLVLTLDRDLQKLSEDLLGDSLGAVIVINPQNGEIYVAVSKPDYEPDFMSSRFTQEEYNLLLLDPAAPFYNRVSQSVFPPGSTYKLIGAITALNENILEADQKFTCTGSWRLGNKTHYCWRRAGHGTLTIAQAIEQSCNIYFYNLSQKLTFDIFASYGEKFLFGTSPGLDIPGEQQNPGILPTSEYMDNKYKNDWNEKGMMAIQIIGQGDLLVTPLQMARFAGAIGTRGKMVTPRFLREVVDSKTNEVLFRSQENVVQIEGIKDEVWDLVREGMRNVVNGERGTARTVRHKEVVIAGKTGTSENNGQDHAWFIGYAPEENPTIALAVFVENGGGGGRVAAPIAREIFKEYFRLQKTRKNTLLSSKIK